MGYSASMDEAVGYLLRLRARLRHPEARAIIDRCLVLISRAAGADAAEAQALEREVATLADELALRFGAPADAVLN